MVNLKKAAVLFLTFIFLFCSSACDRKTEEVDKGIKVVATLFPQYDFARQIIGDKGEVSLLLQPGTESHDYELTNSDMLKINKCDLFLYTGDNMEPWVSSIKYSIDWEKVTIVELSNGIELKAHHNHDLDDSHYHDHSHGNKNA